MDLHPVHEALFGFAERPFSLRPDPKYYFRSRSHSRAFDALSAGIAHRDSLLLLTGDHGVGKTTLCRTFIDLLDRETRAALIGTALLPPEGLLRLLLQDLGAVAKEEVRAGRLVGATLAELQLILDEFLLHLRSSKSGAVLFVDEAHSLPPATVELIVELATVESSLENVLQIVLVAQPPVAGGSALPRALDDRLNTRVRLLHLERNECERYISHRLAIAGGVSVGFSARAVAVVYDLSGGVPRLVNLLCERGMQEALAAGSHLVEPVMVESAASGLELLRLRPRRFRWFGANAR